MQICHPNWVSLQRPWSIKMILGDFEWLWNSGMMRQLTCVASSIWKTISVRKEEVGGVLGRMKGQFLDCGVLNIFVCWRESRSREVEGNPGARWDADDRELQEGRDGLPRTDPLVEAFLTGVLHNMAYLPGSIPNCSSQSIRQTLPSLDTTCALSYITGHETSVNPLKSESLFSHIVTENFMRTITIIPFGKLQEYVDLN